jgi:hypothetical protein
VEAGARVGWVRKPKSGLGWETGTGDAVYRLADASSPDVGRLLQFADRHLHRFRLLTGVLGVCMPRNRSRHSSIAE